jgi:hypothetical protein
MGSIRALLFRVISQTALSYHDSPLSQGMAGKVRGGDRLPWVPGEGSDNHESLAAITWQVHVYGSARADLKAWCEAHHLPLHVYAWAHAHERAGLARDAAYLLRPDTYVAVAEPSGAPAVLEAYLKEWGPPSL